MAHYELVRTDAALPLYPQQTMTQATDRRARRAGLNVKKRRCGTVYADPVTGESVYTGNRRWKSFHRERKIESFLRRRERNGMD